MTVTHLRGGHRQVIYDTETGIEVVEQASRPESTRWYIEPAMPTIFLAKSMYEYRRLKRVSAHWPYSCL